MRRSLIYVALLVALFSTWLIWVTVWYQSVEPAGTTLTDHLAHRPPAERCVVIVRDNQEYLVLEGPWLAIPRFPSGAPLYIFDLAGNLVDWTPDAGDAPVFHKRWSELSNGREIDQNGLANWIAGNR